MTYQLSPRHQNLVLRIIDRCQYRDAEQVIDEALRVLAERLAQLRAAIAEGNAAIAHGDLFDWTPDFLEQLDRESTAAERQVPSTDNGAQPKAEAACG